MASSCFLFTLVSSEVLYIAVDKELGFILGMDCQVLFTLGGGPVA